jgi:hypothetical protein
LLLSHAKHFWSSDITLLSSVILSFSLKAITKFSSSLQHFNFAPQARQNTFSSLDGRDDFELAIEFSCRPITTVACSPSSGRIFITKTSPNSTDGTRQGCVSEKLEKLRESKKCSWKARDFLPGKAPQWLRDHVTAGNFSSSPRPRCALIFHARLRRVSTAQRT